MKHLETKNDKATVIRNAYSFSSQTVKTKRTQVKDTKSNTYTYLKFKCLLYLRHTPTRALKWQANN